MNPWDAKLISAAFENYLRNAGIPIPHAIPPGNSRGLGIVCMDERISSVDIGRKALRNAGARVPRYVDGGGADGELAYDLGVVLGSTNPGENAALLVTGHTDCKANTQLFEILTGTGADAAARKPTNAEIARIPPELQESLIKAFSNNVDKAALVEAMTRILALQNMQNMLQYTTLDGKPLREMLAAGNIFPIVAVIDSNTQAVDIYDWEEKAYRPLVEIVKDAEKAEVHSPLAAPASFVIGKGANTTTVTEFFGKELLGTIRASVEKLGAMTSHGVAHG